MYGVEQFDAIINSPQVAILAVGAGTKKPVLIGGILQNRTVMNCTLSIDHRALDGTDGAEFLKILKELMENPVELLLN